MKKMNKKGFTLIEMLVVIAIIAVLVSIVIPTVSSATEKAKEAADVANIRSAIATVTTNGLAGGDVLSVDVPMTQTKTGFQTTEITSIGGIDGNSTTTGKDFNKIAATTGKTLTISWNSGAVTVTGF